ncbi:MAG: DUF1761 family protein [Robiginitomaculum sp.]|nr:DUF1761 family protein [Robiginitomaculum sp.]
MPKVFGLNLLGWIITSIAFFLLGFVFFGVIFLEKMTELMDYDENTVWNFSQGVQMALGFVNVAVVSLGIGLVLKWLKVDNMMSAVKYGLILAVVFGITTEAYGWIYGAYPIKMAVIDGAYTLIGYSMVAAIWSFFD